MTKMADLVHRSGMTVENDRNISICVFCGSNSGHHESYRAAARELGRSLASRKVDLVYGGGRVGLMGVLADSVLAAGGIAIGVMPRSLVEREIQHSGLSQLHIVET